MEITTQKEETFDKVKSNLADHLAFHEIYDQFLFHPEDIPMSISEIPQVFTVFRKKVEKYSKVRARISNSRVDKRNKDGYTRREYNLSHLFSTPIYFIKKC